jgi:hypothetical protein
MGLIGQLLDTMGRGRELLDHSAQSCRSATIRVDSPVSGDLCAPDASKT